MRRWLAAMVGVAVAGLLAGCEAESTPLAIVITPTVTPSPQATIAPPITYAIAEDLASFINIAEGLETLAIVDFLSDDGRDEVVIGGYDIIVGLGLDEAWEQSPQMIRSALLINPDLTPLDDAFVLARLREAIDPVALALESGIVGAMGYDNTDARPFGDVRNALANYGYPDGFGLRLTGASIAGQDKLIAQLRRANFDVSFEATIPIEQAHLILAFSGSEDVWNDWEVRYGADKVITLFDVPIRYRVRDDIAIVFNENGLPVPIGDDER